MEAIQRVWVAVLNVRCRGESVREIVEPGEAVDGIYVGGSGDCVGG